MASALLFVSYHIFNVENESENFEKGRLLHDKALDLFNKQDYDAANQLLNQSLDLGFDVAYGLLGESALHLNNLKAAKHYLVEAQGVKNAEKFVPDFYGKANFNLAMVYYIEKNGNIAYKYFKVAKDLGYAKADEFVKLLENKANRLPKG